MTMDRLELRWTEWIEVRRSWLLRARMGIVS
jgi:hypothetical protein